VKAVVYRGSFVRYDVQTIATVAFERNKKVKILKKKRIKQKKKKKKKKNKKKRKDNDSTI